MALGAIVAPLWIAGSAASCLLADPPPELPSSQQTPSIITDSVVPPPGSIFANWPTGGLELYVPVLAVDTTETYQFVVMEDYGTPNSVPLSYAPPRTAGTPCTSPQFNCFFAPPDGGGIESVPVPPIPIPMDSNCHTLTLFVGASPFAFPTEDAAPSLSVAPASTSQGYIVTSVFGKKDQVTWNYDPSGGFGLCPVFDAGGLTDSSPDTPTDAAGPDTVLGNFPEGSGG
jgi:hypothetical protein